MALVASGRDNADAITAAVEHFNNKLRLCRHRFDRYKKRGLLFRTVFQAAEKVLKVLKDVENAHTVLLVMGEEASSAVTASQKPVRNLRCSISLYLVSTNISFNSPKHQS